MIPLVAVSSSDCVDALLQAGFVTRVRSTASVTLERGDRRVVVPECAMLTPEDLLAILRDAAITYGDFLDLLSDTPTDPDVFGPRRSRSVDSFR